MKMVKLFRYPNIVAVKTKNQSVYKLLYENLAVRSPNYWFSKAYKEGRWDGYFRLFNQRRKIFPSGLIDQAIDLIDQNKISYELIDKRTKPEPTLNINSSIKLRPYQQYALERLLKDEQGIVWLPVNAGKTYIALQLIARRQVPTLWVTHRKELAIQTGELIKKYLNIEPGLIGMGHNIIRPITVAMIQTLSQRVKESTKFAQELNDNFDQLIVDECHHVAKNIYYNAMIKLEMYYRYGLSGTPKHRNVVDVFYTKAVFGPILVHMQQKELVKLGVSVQPWVYMIQLPADVSTTMDYADVYDTVVINNPTRTAYIAKIALSYVQEGKQVLIMVDRIQHGENLLNAIKEQYSNVAFISGQETADVRQDAINRFEQSKLQILIATNILNEGVSLHSIDVVIVAGAGKSAVATIQRVGRALRTRIGKDRAIIIDFWDIDKKYLNYHASKRYAVYKREFENVIVLDQNGNQINVEL